MYFEGREITPYQNSVSAATLKEGDVCYTVGFNDDIVLINTLYFIGKNLEPDDPQDEEMLYFQDSTSYFAGIRYHDNDNNDASYLPATFQRQPASTLSGIYNLESALQILMYCFLKQEKGKAT